MCRVADTDWEAEHYWVVSCEKLRADKKILKRVLDRLIVAHRTMSMHTPPIAGLTIHYVFLERTWTA